MPVELFLDRTRMVWHRRQVRKSIGRDVKTGGDKATTYEEVMNIPQVAKHPKGRALVHFIASARARKGILWIRF